LSLFLENAYPDFPKVNPQSLRDAFTLEMQNAEAAYQVLLAQTDAPTFDNTCRAIELLDLEAERLSNLTTICSLSRGSDYADIKTEMGTALTQFSTRLYQERSLYDRVRAVRDSDVGLSMDDKALLESQFAGFKFNGVGLDGAAKNRFKEIAERLTQLGTKFEENNTKNRDAAYLAIPLDTDVDGVPPQALNAALEAAKARSMDGVYVFKAASPASRDVIAFANNRDLRRRMSAVNLSYGRGDGPDSNWPLALEIANLRLEKANLLGYPDYAHMRMDHNRMANRPQIIQELWADLYKVVRPAAEQELQARKDLALERDGITDYQTYDNAYYERLIEERQTSIDMQTVRQYLPVDLIVEGQFKHTQKFMGFTYIERPDLPAVVDEAVTYEVRNDQGQNIGFVMTDMYERAGKRDGACMARVQSRHLAADGTVRPNVAIMFSNFSKGLPGKPALLSLDNTRTLFHENGHLDDTQSCPSDYNSLNTSNAPYDSVEIASRFMEDYMWTPEFTSTYMRHVETGEAMPAEIVQKLRAARRINQAIPILAQLSYSALDMAVHTIRTPLADVDALKKLDEEVLGRYKLLPDGPSIRMTPLYGHIFSSNYAAGYHSYIYSEIYVAALRELFDQKGDYDESLSSLFRTKMLGMGALRDPKLSYQLTTGQEKPEIAAYLRRNGLVPA